MKRELLKKSIVYRFYSIVIMAIFFYMITGSFKEMTLFTALVEVIKTAQYGAFEFGWKKLKKNKVNKRERLFSL